jgi:ElaB/YqjD/DUF883 family membrane-anchored ribosome-binding protein
METKLEVLDGNPTAAARQRVLADLQTLADHAEGLLQATAGDVGAQAQEARARVTAALERAKTTCGQMQEQMTVTAKAAAKKADTVIREHPYESIGVAFGVGLLLGVVFARK